MDIRKIKKLIELLEQSNLVEIEVKEGEESVRIARECPQVSQPMSTALAHLQHPTSAQIVPLASSSAKTEPATLEQESKDDTHAITSPMVGTFYQASSPNAEPLVSVGQKVSVGDAVCIIEAMKIMNQIESDKAGTVLEVLCQDGDGVEFGQHLIKIAPL